MQLCLYFCLKFVISIHDFLIRKSFASKKPQKLKNLKKMLRKSPASDAWAEIFKNADFS